MGILKDKSYLVILMFFFSCSDTRISAIEKLTKISVEDKISFEKEVEHWNDFNGNGYKISIYNIRASALNNMIKECYSKDFKGYDSESPNNPFSKSLILEHIKGSKGIYKTIWEKNELKTVVIDSTNSRLIYFYNIL